MRDRYVIIPAGGTGSRMRSELPKQMLDLCGKPVLRRTVELFLDLPDEVGVLISINPSIRSMWLDYCRDNDFIFPVNVSGFMGSDGGNSLGINGAYSVVLPFFFHRSQTFVPEFLRPFSRPAEERSVTGIWSDVSVHEVRYIDSAAPYAINEFFVQFHKILKLTSNRRIIDDS